MNGYKITLCPECGEHYIITNPYIKNEKLLPCFLCEKMSKKEAIARTKELKHAKQIASIYNYNSNFNMVV